MTTPSVWKNLLQNIYPGPPSGPPADEEILGGTAVQAAEGIHFNNAIATQIYRGIASSPRPSAPSLFVTPDKGQELWISRSDPRKPNSVVMHRVPQITQLHGPQWRIRTTDALLPGATDRAGVVEGFHKRAEILEMYGNIKGRMWYYPYFRAHSGSDGLLGYASTGTSFYAAGIYRAYSLRDFPYLPGVIGEWVCPVYCTEFVTRSAGTLRVADFTLQFADVPYLFHADDVADDLASGLTIGAPTSAGRTNTVLVELPSIPRWNLYITRQVRTLRLPFVIDQATGNADRASWSYSVEGLPPRVVFLGQATRQLRASATVNDPTHNTTFDVTYIARQNSHTDRPAELTSKFKIYVA